jgi:hypothetical protein
LGINESLLAGKMWIFQNFLPQKIKFILKLIKAEFFNDGLIAKGEMRDFLTHRSPFRF